VVHSAHPDVSVPLVPKIPDEQAKRFADALRSPDSNAKEQALDGIAHAMSQSPQLVASHLAFRWNKPLLAMGRYEQVAEWSQKETCIHLEWPLSQSAMEQLQEARVRALLALHRSDEALSAAKSYYNLVSVARTPAAVELLRKSLAADPKFNSMRQVFQAEQKVPTSASTQQVYRGSIRSVKKQIKVDPAPYLNAIDLIKQQLNELQGMAVLNAAMHCGDLFLLADEPDQARQCFDQAYQQTLAHPEAFSYEMRAHIVDSVARCIRAHDGDLVQASAFLAKATR
jgi:tetratricopeptide (TPR) repeat protein